MADVVEKAIRTRISIVAPLEAVFGAIAAALVSRGWLTAIEAIAAVGILKIVLLAILPDDVYRRILKRLAGRGMTDDVNPPPPPPKEAS